MAALVLVGAWIAILSLVVLVLVREVALLRARLDESSQAILMRDGPDVGRALPEAVRASLSGDSFLLLLSAICGPCHDLAKELRTERPPDAPLIALVTGRRELADRIVSELPQWATVIRDPQAGQVARALNIKSTPFAIRVRDGRVAGKAYLRGTRDLLRLAQAGQVSALAAPPQSEEVGHAS